jgi:hypothetical protein
MTSSISSTTPEETRPTVILSSAPEEARLAAILGTTKYRCSLWICDLVYGSYVVYACDEYCEV